MHTPNNAFLSSGPAGSSLSIPVSIDFRERLLTAFVQLASSTESTFSVPVAYLETVSSTMDFAKNADFAALPNSFVPVPVAASRPAAENVQAQLCVVAREQTSGRGRQQRVWQSRSGAGVYLTYRFTLQAEPTNLLGYPLAVAVAVADTAIDLGAKVGLKWPNDIWTVDDAHEPVGKLAGILIETANSGNSSQELSVCVGIGLNLLPFESELPYPRATLSEASAQVLEFEPVAALLLKNVITVTQQFFTGEKGALLERWRSLSFLWGREVELSLSEKVFRGRCVDIDADGGLILEHVETGEKQTFFSHEVTAVLPQRSEGRKDGY